MAKMATFSVLATGREGCGCTVFCIDGQRVSRHHYEELRGRVLQRGRIECMSTEIKGGRVRHRSVYVLPLEGY